MSKPAAVVPPAVVLKDVRARLGLTQRALGQKLGVTTRTVNRWETGDTAMPATMLPRAIALLRARDPAAADRIALERKLPGALAQEEARKAALDHAVYAAADALDVSPRRAREVLAVFLTHLVAAGMSATDARRRLAERIGGARGSEQGEGPAPGAPSAPGRSSERATASAGA